MEITAGSLILFSLAMVAGVFMITEGSLILFLKKRFTPLPTRVLVEISRLAAHRRIKDRTTPKQLCTYASCDLMFGTLVLFSGCAYLFQML